MTGCTWTPNYRRPHDYCRQPGATIRLGCAHEHIYTASLCPEHRQAAQYCYRCATGPATHKCPLTVLVEAVA